MGFESISHSAAEARFSLKNSFKVLCVAVITAAVCYVLLSLLAVKYLPEGASVWTDYIGNLDNYSGTASQPTFNAAYTVLGNTGSVILGAAALGAIFTGLIGNYIALSRLLGTLSKDGLFPKWIGVKKDKYDPAHPCDIGRISFLRPHGHKLDRGCHHGRSHNSICACFGFGMENGALRKKHRVHDIRNDRNDRFGAFCA